MRTRRQSDATSEKSDLPLASPVSSNADDDEKRSNNKRRRLTEEERLMEADEDRPDHAKLRIKLSPGKRPKRKVTKVHSFAEEQARERATQERKLRRARRLRDLAENGEVDEGDEEEEDQNDESEKDVEEHFVRRSTRPRTGVTRFTVTQGDSSEQSEEDQDIDRSRSVSNSKRKKPTSKRRHTKGSRQQEESTTDSSDSEDEFERKERHRLRRARDRIRPVAGLAFDMDVPFESISGSSRDFKKKDPLADIDPITLDTNVDWSDVGGLDAHIRSLKEMVMLPLMYPELFAKFHVSPPKGVLFSGPPGTGKTLVARALAATCSQAGQKVAFFMRKGADCLSKWVGEAERQLRLLFEQAQVHQPSIIFFDEIDGLAPVRSSKQDQIHSSIVSTLLALMDGLDNRGQVIVIGATNRPDSIDPALRRPGRFDRELSFSLPSKEARLTILKIHTKKWEPPLSPSYLLHLAEACAGYCGADLKALCTEAALRAVRRTYPQIYESADKLLVDVSRVKLERVDFESAMASLVPAQHRADAMTCSQQIPKHLTPLLQSPLESVQALLKQIFPLGALPRSKLANTSISPEADPDGSVQSDPCVEVPVPYKPRLLLHGQRGMGQHALASAILHQLEEYPLFSLDLPTLLSCPTCSNPEEAMLRCFSESRRSSPSVIFWPHIDLWWATAPTTLSNTILLLIDDMPTSAPVMLLATADCPIRQLPPVCQALFDPGHASLYCCVSPTIDEKMAFFKPLLTDIQTPPRRRKDEKLFIPPLPKAPKMDMGKPETTPSELQEEQSLLLNLRLFLRGLCNNLWTQFSELQETLEKEVAPKVIRSLTLADMRTKINDHKYLTIKDFLNDVDLLVSNVKEWADMGKLAHQTTVNKACHLQDVALSFVGQLDVRLAKKCEIVAEKIRSRQLLRTSSDSSSNRPVPQKDQKDSPVLDAGELRERASARIRGIPADVQICSLTSLGPPTGTRKPRAPSPNQSPPSANDSRTQSLAALVASATGNAISKTVDFSTSVSSMTTLTSTANIDDVVASSTTIADGATSPIETNGSSNTAMLVLPLPSSSSSTTSSSSSAPFPNSSLFSFPVYSRSSPPPGSVSTSSASSSSPASISSGSSPSAPFPCTQESTSTPSSSSTHELHPAESKNILTSADIDQFRALLLEKTTHSSVDELEVIRFKLYRCFHRYEGDKINLLTQLQHDLTYL